MRKFTSGLNAAKNTEYIEKCFEQKLFRIKFPTKKSVGAYVYLHPHPPSHCKARGAPFNSSTI